MYIEIQIPYGTEQRLADAYNQALINGTSEWILFLDHDVFLCNPRWYDMCVTAIDTLSVDPQAACITCERAGEWFNAHRNKGVRTPNGDIDYHIEKSKEYGCGPQK